MRKSFIFLSIFGFFASVLTAFVIYFIKRGEELSTTSDSDFFGTKDPFCWD